MLDVTRRRAPLAFAALLATLRGAAANGATIFHRGNDGDPETLDPHRTSTVAEAHLLRDLREGLVINNVKGEVVAGVAESWTTSDDGRLWRFSLRSDAKWSNGEPLRASDFVHSFRRIINPETGAKYANLLFPIRNAEAIHKAATGSALEDLGVRAPDDRTLEIELERPTPYLLELLTHQSALPVHPASAAKASLAPTSTGSWITNGAYSLSEFVPNSHIRLDRNPHFHDASQVKIDTVIFYPAPDLAAAAQRFLAGELQLTTDIPADQVKELRRKLGDQVQIGPYLATYFLILNTSKQPFDDPRVRRALSLQIDRDFIADAIWGGTMLPAYGVIPPHIGNYGERAEMDFRYESGLEREDEARQLLGAAGFGSGMPLDIEFRFNTTDNNRRTAAAIAEQWRAIGVETRFVETDYRAHFAYLRSGGDFDVARYGWIGDYSDPQNFLFLFQSDNPGFNIGKYANPRFDALMKLAADELDIAKRAAILREADSIVTTEQPWIPVLHYSTKNLVSPRLSGFEQNLRGVVPTRFLSLAT
ncbi:MAG: peptide ABC transporter substrate-binding protein [Bosea sp.]|uniref:peptide ABC transporter substrate-binding protein n=1 Tax=unclassified Bosea (in: a-proteobacteria) TaxID=2653178 RepID=UPI0009591473|nr:MULTISPECIES: peptide ABC transporter substrate-binding protein [unclassified Bosea (in: a-proteobacteria)]MBN9456721.1 peptide ABC transporter substrate-binding protein [Bosea sp. (in: a-proteobacteria)]OJV08942.1 MAG: ABC transporter substrate-binding protein [Bosea sp. 67-29]